MLDFIIALIKFLAIPVAIAVPAWLFVIDQMDKHTRFGDWLNRLFWMY